MFINVLLSIIAQLIIELIRSWAMSFLANILQGESGVKSKLSMEVEMEGSDFSHSAFILFDCTLTFAAFVIRQKCERNESR